MVVDDDWPSFQADAGRQRENLNSTGGQPQDSERDHDI